jgi:hypothetical protein
VVKKTVQLALWSALSRREVFRRGGLFAAGGLLGGNQARAAAYALRTEGAKVIVAARREESRPGFFAAFVG